MKYFFILFIFTLYNCTSHKKSFTDEDITYSGSGFTVSTAEIDFKNIEIGRSEELNFFVTNDGGKQTGIKLKQACSKDFSFKMVSCFFLEPGSSSCTVDVIFKPLTASNKACVVTLISSEGDTKIINIKGRGERVRH